jgi:predicted DNA-binding transcriptional regulator AlpA
LPAKGLRSEHRTPEAFVVLATDDVAVAVESYREVQSLFEVDPLMKPDEAPLLTVRQAMSLLAVGRTTLYSMMNHRDVAVVHVNGCTRILRSSVEEYIRRNTIPAAKGT